MPSRPASSTGLPTWAGFHTGVNGSAGALFGNYEFGPAGHGTGPALQTGFGESKRDTPVLAGGYAGYNWQFRRAVFGVEGHLELALLSRSAPDDLAASIGVARRSPGSDLLTARTSYSGAIQARIGYAFDYFLPNLSFGVAFTNARFSTASVDGLGSTIAEQLNVGYTIGGGFETVVGPNTTIGVHYRYSDYGGGARVLIPQLGPEPLPFGSLRTK